MNVVSTRRSAVAGCLAGLALCAVAWTMPTGVVDADGPLVPKPALENSDSSSIVDNYEFTISTAEYVERLNAAYTLICLTGNKNLYEVVEPDDKENGNFTIQMMKSAKKCGTVLFSCGTTSIKWANKDKESILDSVCFEFDVNDRAATQCLAYTAVAAILASDPSMNLAYATALASKLIDGYNQTEESGLVEQNGIAYRLSEYDGTLLLQVLCDDIYVSGNNSIDIPAVIPIGLPDSN